MQKTKSETSWRPPLFLLGLLAVLVSLSTTAPLRGQVDGDALAAESAAGSDEPAVPRQSYLKWALGALGVPYFMVFLALSFTLVALLVMNLLKRAGVPEIPVASEDRGPNFYDVSGEKRITSFDALLVINELGVRNVSGQQEAEQVFADSAAAPEASTTVPLSDPSTVNNELERVVDASVPEVIDGDVIDLIASSQSDDDDDSDADEAEDDEDKAEG